MTLQPVEKIIYLEQLAAFRRDAGPYARLTARSLAKQYRVSEKTARRALIALELRGWITREGFSPGPTGQAGGRYRLTALTKEGRPQRGPFYEWTPVQSERVVERARTVDEQK